MEIKGFYLSEADRDVIRQLVDERLRIITYRTPDFNDPQDVKEQQAGETYIARTLSSGIPPLSGMVPGQAKCNIYRLTRYGDSSALLTQIPGKTHTVYNLSTVHVGGTVWVPVVKEKFGGWVAVASGTTTTLDTYQTIRLPCVVDSGSDGGSVGDGGGIAPCFSIIDRGVIFYGCGGDSGGPGFGAIIDCDDTDPVNVPQQLQVTASDGTRSFEAIGSITVIATRSGIVWPVSFVFNGIRISGYLTYCCNATPHALYFVGSAASTYNDPEEEYDPYDLYCGCARNFSACPPSPGQSITSGPTYDPFSQEIELDVGCGTVTLTIGVCPDPDGWQGPGFYYVSGHTGPLAVDEGEQCGLILLCGRYNTYGEAIAAYEECFGSGDTIAGNLEGCCAGHPTSTGGTAVAHATIIPCTQAVLPEGPITADENGNFTSVNWPAGYSLTFPRCTEVGVIDPVLLTTPSGEYEGLIEFLNCDIDGKVVLRIAFETDDDPCNGIWFLTVTLD